jgi:2-polyprenyl-6-methoxyphenol hydroxylase-like FAD-dependent oxidoreductase
MHAIVIGAGIGGLAAALTLRRARIAVDVFEQAAVLREVGAGIQISPNATRILERLGLGNEMRRAGVRPIATQIRRWDNGALLARYPLADLCERHYGAPYYHFHRAELLDILAAAVPRDVLHLDHRCIALAERAGRVEVTFHDGATADADVVIGADGIHSTVRELIIGKESPRFSGHVAYRGLVPAERVAHLDIERSAYAWWGPHRHFVHYFVGAGARYLNWVTAIPSQWRLESWSAKGELKDAVAEFEGWHPLIREIILAADSTNRWALYDRDPLPRWSAGRVALIGDAAHPMLPYMAQGAVQSIEDAAVLAKCLEQADEVEGALQRYERMRKERASRCQQGARRRAVLNHLPDGDEQRARDAELAAGGSAFGAEWLYGHDVEAEFAASPRIAR